jgi:hypothetical protein
MLLPYPSGAGGEARYRDLTFRAFSQLNGVAELDPSMAPSAGGAATDPDFVFYGGDADGTSWTTNTFPATPVACAKQAVGVVPTYNDGSPLLGTNDDSVLFNASDYYAAPNNTFGQVTTEDIVFELVFKTNALAGAKYLAGTRVGGVGWSLATVAGNDVRILIEDASGDVTIASAALNEYTWYHVLFFLNRDGSGQCYVNGDASGAAVDISGRALTISGESDMCIGSRGGGNTPYDSNIAYLAMWKGASWLTSHLNPDTAAERFGLLAGYWPQVANGTSAPNTATRAYQAYTEKIESSKTRLYQVGGEWLRFCQRVDGNSETVNGYLAEPAATNDLDNGDVFAGWTKDDAGDVITDDAALGPDNLTSMATLVCDNTDGDHGIRDATANALSAVNHCVSVVIGTGTADWWRLQNMTVAACYVYFNITTGAFGAVGAGVSEYGFVEGEYLGSGTKVRRPYIRFTGTAAAHTIRVSPCKSGTNATYDGGDGAAVTGYLFGAQVEEGDYPSSIVITAGAAATRLADQLQFKMDDGSLGGVGSEGRGSLEVDFLKPDFSLDTQNDMLFEISDGGAIGDRIITYNNKTANKLTMATRAAGGTSGDASTTSDMCDGNRHRYRLTWATNDVRQVVDGSLEGTEAAADMPDDLDEIDVGMNRANTTQFNGLISDLKIWSRNKVR